jgi:hypothetical protein
VGDEALVEEAEKDDEDGEDEDGSEHRRRQLGARAVRAGLLEVRRSTSLKT